MKFFKYIILSLIFFYNPTTNTTQFNFGNTYTINGLSEEQKKILLESINKTQTLKFILFQHATNSFFQGLGTALGQLLYDGMSHSVEEIRIMLGYKSLERFIKEGTALNQDVSSLLSMIQSGQTPETDDIKRRQLNILKLRTEHLERCTGIKKPTKNFNRTLEDLARYKEEKKKKEAISSQNVVHADA